MSEGGAATEGRVQVETPEAVAFTYELAGLLSRGVAFLIDLAVLFGLALAESVFAGLVMLAVSFIARPLVEPLLPWVVGITIAAVALTGWGYFVYGEVGHNGRTYGKRRMGLRVVRDDGSRVGFLDSMIRNVLRLVDALPGSFTTGMVSILLSSRNKRLGDMAAGTVVVRDSGDAPLYLDGETLSERDSLAREFLARRASLTPEGRYQAAVAVLGAYGEQPGSWDEPTIAGRIADLSGARASGEGTDGVLPGGGR